MVSRRDSLRLASTALVAALAGCSSGVLDAEDAQPTHTLDVEPIDEKPVEYALYEPPTGDLFGGPARAALDAILPSGRYRTYGYQSLSEGNYVDHDGSYYRTEQFVTGQQTLTRPVVRVEAVDEDALPDDAVSVDTLDQPSARPLKILHSDAVTDGESGAANLLRDDGYVMTRPAERESRLVTGDLDGRVATMTDSGAWAHRIHVSRESLTLKQHTVLAIEVADSRAAFRDVVLGSRIDADLGNERLSGDGRDLLDQAISRDAYRETGDLSEAFQILLESLGFDTGEPATGRIVWDGQNLFRASYYVNDAG